MIEAVLQRQLMTGDYEQYPNDWQAASKTETGSTAGRVHDKANTFFMSPQHLLWIHQPQSRVSTHHLTAESAAP
jgi:hypothetical protein